MFSGVKSALSAAFYPARVLHHGWKHREDIPDDPAATPASTPRNRNRWPRADRP